MRHYENLVIVKPTLTEEEIKSSLATIEEILTSNGAEIVTKDDMGMKKLAYPIEKNARGYMQVIYFKIDPSKIQEVERRYRINEELLRFVTIKYESKREVKAFDQLVEKTVKKAAFKAEAAKTAEAPKEVAATEAPVETPAAAE